ncbi:hypothetical protein RvY_10547 [Ramazzottius varieornatus]|uniref:RNB domain-containing protein n=1 Tax=Ramazzottius varieornatus TaxID=947166 RepID=A0A1D1VD31_RAMVA|nr:hypothetical protein RvY_10547 [Ramazzottius varieornatus]
MAFSTTRSKTKKSAGANGKENDAQSSVMQQLLDHSSESEHCQPSVNLESLDEYGFPQGTVVQAYQYSSPRHHIDSDASYDETKKLTICPDSVPSGISPFDAVNYPQAKLSTTNRPNLQNDQNLPRAPPQYATLSNATSRGFYPSSSRGTPQASYSRGNGGPSPRGIKQYSLSNKALPPKFPSQYSRLSPQSQLGCDTVSPLAVNVPKMQTPPAPARRTPKPCFEAYVGVERKDAGLKVGLFEQGQLVISPKSPDQAYVRVPGKLNEDINISGAKHRNRALNGDIVVVEVFPKSLWKIRPDCVETVQAELGIESLGDCKSKDDIQRLIVTNKKATEVLNIDAIEIDALKSGSSDDSADWEPCTPPAPSTSQDTKVFATVLKKENEKNVQKNAKKSTPRKPAQKQGEKWMDILVENVGLENIPEKWLQKTGKVVFIAEMKGPRKVVGNLIYSSETRTGEVPRIMVKPCDARMPLVWIPHRAIPPEMKSDVLAQKGRKDLLYLAEIVEWRDYQYDPYAKLIRCIGTSGNIDSFTAIMMTENGVEEEDFSAKITKELIRSNRIVSCEKEQRTDFRNNCVFTIDPPDAKDLDDAVSCERLGNGVYRVGVHISDVSYVIPEGCELDKYAAERGTTVYMINKVVHMLPPKLIEATCSLDPGVDRRTLSAIFTMTEEGDMLDYQVVRGVIRSCAKLSYRQAQDIIDGKEAAQVLDGVVAPRAMMESVKDTITDLHAITQAMRALRSEKGCLRIDQPEFYFQLDEARMPTTMQVREHWQSCQLIEELALLTNQITAKMIFDRCPEVALLRRHPEPLDSAMQSMQKLCTLESMPMSIECAKSIQNSMSEIVQKRPDLLPVISYLCAKPMKLAEYCCTGAQSDTWHYALGVEHYTHMTSPIRRYADIIVHRLLSALLGYTKLNSLTMERVQDIAGVCNERKYAAKRCQEASNTLYMGLYISRHGPLVEDGVVVAVYGASLSVDILVPRLAVAQRVFVRKVPGVERVTHRVVDQRHFLDVVWKRGNVKQTLTVWKDVKAVVSVAFEEVRNIKLSLQQPGVKPPQVPL